MKSFARSCAMGRSSGWSSKCSFYCRAWSSGVSILVNLRFAGFVVRDDGVAVGVEPLAERFTSSVLFDGVEVVHGFDAFNFPARILAHNALAALLADSDRCRADILAALAFPPFLSLS